MTQVPGSGMGGGSSAGELEYAQYSFGNAATLLKLAGIFNAVVAGLNWIAMVFYFLMTGVLATVLSGVTGAGGVSGPARPPMPVWFIVIMYGGLGLLAGAAGVVQCVAAVKFLRRRRNAWVWGVVAGVASCVNFWCHIGCLLPMASGVFTLVVAFLPNTRGYLEQHNRGADGGVTGAFPVGR